MSSFTFALHTCFENFSSLCLLKLQKNELTESVTERELEGKEKSRREKPKQVSLSAVNESILKKSACKLHFPVVILAVEMY